MKLQVFSAVRRCGLLLFAVAAGAEASAPDVVVEAAGRRAFLHGERGAKLAVSIVDGNAGRRETRLIPVETRVREGRRAAKVSYGGRDYELAYDVGPDFAPRMPIVAWHCDDYRHARDMGFTHVTERYLGRLRTNAIPLTPVIEMLDGALADGLRMIRQIWLRPAFVDVSDAARPEVADFARRMEEGSLRDMGDHPAFVGLLPNSEHVDGAKPIRGVTDARYRRETGREIPEWMQGLKVANFNDSKARYPGGLVPEDDPALAYLRWWWSDGNGWPRVNSAMAAVYRPLRARREFVTFWDPAVRCFPIWGSGGDVDMLNQWVYANPEPLAVAGPAEELFAMARGRGQKVAIMTQLMCYRSKIAPASMAVANPPPWVAKFPETDFVAIPPDVLQEATWAMLSKPVRSVMFYGYGSIYDTGVKKGGYPFSNEETPARMRSLIRDVIAPLGPTLREIPRRAQEVAVLESFTSAALGAPFGRGWSAPPVTFLQRARLDPQVVYEQDLERGGLDGVKVLYLPQCDFLTKATADRVRAFQAAGGIVVADARCASAVRPDVVVPEQRFPSPPASDYAKDVDEQAKRLAADMTRAATRRAKESMLAAAEDLRRKLAGRYEPRADSSSPELVTFARQFGGTPYLFAINDRRDFGDYVGQWGACMERGLPNAGEVSVADPESRIRAVYELSRGGKAGFARRDGRVVVPVSFDTNDGRLFAFLDREIAEVRASLSGEGRGGVIRAKAEVLDARGRRVPGALPVEMRLYAADGFELSGGGWACAKDGVAELDFQTNLDDPPLAYRLVVRDKATGLGDSRSLAP